MVTRTYKRDFGLTVRMFLTMLLLAVVYIGFLAILSRFMMFTWVLMFAALMLFAQLYYSDKLVLWSMGARIVGREEAPELHAIVEKLCTLADLPKPKIAIVDTNVPNAFATGRNKKNAVVAVTTGLLRTLSRNELEAVLAHELSHIKNKDMLVLTIASFISMVAFFVMRYAIFFGIGGGRRDNAYILLVWVASIITWIVSFILIRALSRYREFAADRGSAFITGRPRDLISALYKISGKMQRIPTEDLRKVEGLNAFFIIPAVSGDLITKLFSTHPPLEERVKALETLEKMMERI
ncbi:zinc metalloprotease HtpX [Methanosarcinales archaeon]|nr:MAG: zinc metalloprotease HtpX [Methanosarcinales archaeon]